MFVVDAINMFINVLFCLYANAKIHVRDKIIFTNKMTSHIVVCHIVIGCKHMTTNDNQQHWSKQSSK